VLRLMFVTLVMLLCLHTSLAIAAPAADIAASVQPPLYAIYEARQFAPLWLDNGKPSARASEAITVISQAADDGLDTSDYDLPALRQQLETMLQQPGDDRQQADFDLALSLTLAAFVEDLSVGRIAPLEPGAKTDVASRQVDLPARLQQILTSDNLQQRSPLHAPLSLPTTPCANCLSSTVRSPRNIHKRLPCLRCLPKNWNRVRHGMVYINWQTGW
jgi:murein L,D-transpeptidase YcbB/YkuD